MINRKSIAFCALREAAQHPPQLILLDLGLPDGDGADILPRLRGFCAAPVIVLSARERTAEKIRALDAGAADYVEKPFDLGELQARIRAALRHPGKVITHRQLLINIWGPAHGADVQYLRVYVRQLRLKLGDREGIFLRTEPNIGYRLVVPETTRPDTG